MLVNLSRELHPARRETRANTRVPRRPPGGRGGDLGQGESGNVPYLSIPQWGRTACQMMGVCMRAVIITAKQNRELDFVVLCGMCLITRQAHSQIRRFIALAVLPVSDLSAQDLAKMEGRYCLPMGHVVGCCLMEVFF